MNKIPTKSIPPEVSLPIAPSIGEIDHFRIINKNGESQKATITQVRELMGIDYSIFEEQIVPGEYALNWNGVRSQVYVKTIRMTAASSGSTIVYNISSLRSVILSSFGSTIGYPPQMLRVELLNSNTVGTTVWGIPAGVLSPGRDFYVTIKYTK